MKSKTPNLGKLKTALRMASPILFLLFTPAISHANSTGADLLRDCKIAASYLADRRPIDPKDKLSFGLCVGFIDGYLQGFDGKYTVVDKTVAHVVVQDNVSPQDLANKIVAFLTENPEELKEDAGNVFRRMLVRNHLVKFVAVGNISER